MQAWRGGPPRPAIRRSRKASGHAHASGQCQSSHVMDRRAGRAWLSSCSSTKSALSSSCSQSSVLSGSADTLAAHGVSGSARTLTTAPSSRPWRRASAAGTSSTWPAAAAPVHATCHTPASARRAAAPPAAGACVGAPPEPVAERCPSGVCSGSGGDRATTWRCGGAQLQHQRQRRLRLQQARDERRRQRHPARPLRGEANRELAEPAAQRSARAHVP